MSVSETTKISSGTRFIHAASSHFDLPLKLLVVLLITMGVHQSIFAASTWNITTGGSWNTASDWTPNGVPVTGSDIIFSSATAGGSAKATTLDKAFSINSLTFNATQTGAVSITNNTLTLNPSANNATTILVDTASGDHSISSSIILAGVTNQAFSIGANRTFTIGGNISGSSTSRALTKNGTGTLVLSGADTFAGGTTLSAGTIAIGSNGIVAAAGTLTSGPVGVSTLTIGDGTTFAANSATARAIENNLSLSGNIILGDATNSGALTFSSTDGTNTLATAGAVTLTANTKLTLNSAVTINDAISGSGINLEKAGSGTLNLGKANGFSGTFTASGGITNLNINGALGSVTSVSIGTGTTVQTPGSGTTDVINDAAAITMDGTANFDLRGGTETVGSLTSTSGAPTLQIGKFNSVAGSFTVGNANSTAFAGVISGAPVSAGGIIFTKQGSGTLTLTGVNTMSGGVAITAGTLAASATGANKALGAITSVAISNGGTLLLGNSNQVNAAATMTLGSATGSGAATFNAAGYSQGTTGTAGLGALTLKATATIDFGAANAGNILHFANSGTTSWTSGTILFINNYTGSVIEQDGSTVVGTTNDALLFGSDATGLNSTQITQVEFVNPSGYTGTFGASIDSTGMVFADVPEPATVFAGALMVGALGWNQRRRLGGLAGLMRTRRKACDVNGVSQHILTAIVCGQAGRGRTRAWYVSLE